MRPARTMKVTEQIDAINTMLRTDRMSYLVVPRVMALVIMAPVQCMLFFLRSGCGRGS